MEVPEAIILVEKELKWLAHLYVSSLEHKQSVEMKIQKLKQTLGEPPDYIRDYLKTIEENHSVLLEIVDVIAQRHPVYINYISRIKGMKSIGALLLGIAPARKFATISKLWKYLGLLPRKYYLEQLGGLKYHRLGSRILHIAIQNCFKRKNMYYHYYWYFREKLNEKPEWRDRPEAHKHTKALNKVKRLFISHYWTMYRHILGLPIRPPYAVEKGLEKSIILPFIEVPKLTYIDVYGGKETSTVEKHKII